MHLVDDAPEAYRESIDADISKLLFDPVYAELKAVHGAYELKEVGLGVSGNNIWTSYYLVAPLTNGLIDLSAAAKLGKANRSARLSTSGLAVRPIDPHRTAAGEWNPVLGWPTEAEIQEHLADETHIKDPELDAEAVSALIQSDSPFASTMALYHQNLPLRFLPEFAASDETRLRIAAARNEATDAVILAKLAQDPDSLVRLAVAVNPATPLHLINALARDETELVRGVAVRRADTTS